MRLVCPNCAMKYEVPDDAIPEAGRDVQCANCGHGWYQTRPQLKAVPIPGPAPAPAPADSDPAKPQIAANGAATSAAAETAAPQDVRAVGAVPPAKADASADPVAAAALAAALTDVPTRSVDEKVLAILREEAEREAKARREESQQLESPDGPVPGPAQVGPPPDPEPAPEPLAKPEGQGLLPKTEDAGPAQEGLAEPAPIGDGNSSGDQLVTPLPDKTTEGAAIPQSAASPAEASVVPAAAPVQDAGADSPAETPPVATPAVVPDAPSTTTALPVADGPAAKQGAKPDSRRRQAGFRAGFLLVIGVAVLAAAVYLGAEQLSRAVPALAGPLAGYVDLVNGLRQGLDGLAQDARRFIAGNGG